MFTGLVEGTGRVVFFVKRGGMIRFGIVAGRLAKDMRVGDSVSVNGVCLTVNEREGEVLVFLAMPESLRRTSLSGLKEGSIVNLERAMTPQARFGGHIVQGHVDGVGKVLNVRPDGGAEVWEFAAPEAVLRYGVEKGSVCVDGISLTLVSVKEASFIVSILPQTKEVTNLRYLRPGDRVNLEADIIAKYVERLLVPRSGKNSQTSERRVEDAV
ncbi:MAG TPA: riboflavin synthase [Rubrobacteraceae bacterium]|jgi:riboflavin synthase|nr:riboflavin synthase [Rubrobacteraceae bacterium]